MSNISHSELFQMVRKHLDVDGLIRQNPGVTRRDVENLFSHLAAMLEAKTGRPGPTRALYDEGGIPEGAFVICTDGTSRGNPGPAGIGVVLLDSEGGVVEEISRPIGEATNNVAEYMAVLEGLKLARDHGAEKVVIRTDSELLARQLKGTYKVKSRNILPLCLRVMEQLRGFSSWQVVKVPRDENVRADKLADLAVKGRPRSEQKGGLASGSAHR